jgi:hypothetical protein
LGWVGFWASAFAAPSRSVRMLRDIEIGYSLMEGGKGIEKGIDITNGWERKGGSDRQVAWCVRENKGD